VTETTSRTIKEEQGRRIAADLALSARIARLEAPVVVPPVVPPPPVIIPVVSTISVAAGGKGVTINRDGQVIENLVITGPGCATYDGATYGIFGSGAFRDVAIRHCTIRNLAHSGIWLDGLVNPVIEDCVIEDVAYAGIMFVGVQGGRISRNTVRRVGVTGHQEPDCNAYGIAVAGSDVLVDENEVTDVPLWHGLDTHGGLRITFRRNVVRRTPRAMFVTTGASPAADCVVTGNLLTEPAPLLPGGTNPVAITTYQTVGCTIAGNVIGAAYGAPTAYDYGALSTGLVQSGNVTGEALP
jgi:parallel beta-helix repeat protein